MSYTIHQWTIIHSALRWCIPSFCQKWPYAWFVLQGHVCKCGGLTVYVLSGQTSLSRCVKAVRLWRKRRLSKPCWTRCASATSVSGYYRLAYQSFLWCGLELLGHVNSPCFLPAAVKAKISRHRLPSADPELTVEGPVELIQRGPLLPYDTVSLLQRWLLINLRCAHTLVRPGRAQLYLVTGTMRATGSIQLSSLFPWLKKDLHITAAARKWKHHKCWS